MIPASCRVQLKETDYTLLRAESVSVWQVSAFWRYDSSVTGGGAGSGGGGAVAIFSCTISRSIIARWITSIAGDNRQAVERTGRYRTPTPVWEAVWIISSLPAGPWGLWRTGGLWIMGQHKFESTSHLCGISSANLFVLTNVWILKYVFENEQL